jgi:hypothetical protein
MYMGGKCNLYGVMSIYVRGLIVYIGYILLGVRQFVGEYETLFAVLYFIWGTTFCMGVLHFIWGYDNLCRA